MLQFSFVSVPDTKNEIYVTKNKWVVKRSTLAQRKRDGPATQRSLDQNQKALTKVSFPVIAPKWCDHILTYLHIVHAPSIARWTLNPEVVRLFPFRVNNYRRLLHPVHISRVVSFASFDWRQGEDKRKFVQINVMHCILHRWSFLYGSVGRAYGY